MGVGGQVMSLMWVHTTLMWGRGLDGDSQQSRATVKLRPSASWSATWGVRGARGVAQRDGDTALTTERTVVGTGTEQQRRGWSASTAVACWVYGVQGAR